MNRVFYVLLALIFLHLIAPVANAAINRDPIGVNVSANRPMSLGVRFASSDGTRFTSDQALFCFRQLASGQCDPSAILGRLSRSRDRGSTTVPVTGISDVMTIPYSVIRSTLSIAQNVDFSDFYYVRRFLPESGGDLGAGVNQPVYQKVTCHLAGPARIPLSLTSVRLFSTEPGHDNLTVIRLDSENLNKGQAFARLEHTGTGYIEGWWEVRLPGEAPLSDSDRLPQAALAPAERGLQKHYRRVKRFRAQATTAGHLLLDGPTYLDLPRSLSGRHELLLRISSGRGRENRARLAVEGEPLNLFSGAVAAFALPSLEYHVPVRLAVRQGAEQSDDRATLYREDDGSGERWRLVWRSFSDPSLVVQLTVGNAVPLLVSARERMLEIPPDIAALLPEEAVAINLLDSSGQQVGSIAVSVRP